MRYLALACDYDGTIATDGTVADEVLLGLRRLADSGRRLILASGRDLDSLLEAMPTLDVFDRVVAENGALLYRPATKEIKLLGEAPPEELVARLRARRVEPLSLGQSILATSRPHETTVLEVIRDLGLEHQVIFNKGSVMVLPPGVNKGTGLRVALDELGLSVHNTVGVGDAENDHAFLSACECSVAVATALDVIKERADYTTGGRVPGADVLELIDMILADDLQSLEPRLGRHEMVLGSRPDGQEIRVKPYGTAVLIAGPSGSGKSTVALSLLEVVADCGYQFCLIDPEGDFAALEIAVAHGSRKAAPSAEEVLQILASPQQSVVVNLLGLPLAERPRFFTTLLPRLQELRARTGRPHWLIVDEAHHLLPSGWSPAPDVLPQELGTAALITVHPGQVSRHALAGVGLVIAVGARPGATLRAFATVVDGAPPSGARTTARSGEVIAWQRAAGSPPFRLIPSAPRHEHLRHVRKYAEGDVGVEQSFYFRGPEGQLNLRVQNLMLFVQVAQGVDDGTWTYHLRRGDYSAWFREVIKDEDLVSQAAQIERDRRLSPKTSRARIKAAIEQRYTAPAG